MADLFDIEADPYGLGKARRRGQPVTTGGGAVPRTTTVTMPGLQPSVSGQSGTSGIAPTTGIVATDPQPRLDQDYRNTVGNFLTENAFGPSSLVRDLNETSPKRMIGRVTSHFDPAKGFTPEMLSAINALDIGDFSYRGPDVLEVRNARNNAGWGSVAPGQIGAWDLNAAYDPARGTSGGWQFQDLMAGSAPSASGSASGIDPALAAILAMFQQPVPQTPAPQQDLSWLQPLLEQLASPASQTPAPATTPAAVPRAGATVPPTFVGAAETPLQGGGGTEMSRAMQLLSMHLPRVLGQPTGAEDPMLAQLRRLIGVA